MAKTGFIYKIIDNTNGNQYYGSTAQRVAQRMTGHRSSLNAPSKKRCASYAIIKNGDWRYETVEKFTYNDKFELRNREQYYIQNNECVNKKRPSNTYRDKVNIFKKMQKAFTCTESLDNITIPENIDELYNDYMNCIRSRSKTSYDFSKIQDVRNCMVGIGHLLFGYSFYKKVGQAETSTYKNGKRVRTRTIIYDYDKEFIQLDEWAEELQMQIDDIQRMIDFYHHH